MDNTELKTIEKEEKNAKAQNIETIYQSFNDNVDAVNSYFKKFEGIAIGEDETMKVESTEFYKDVSSMIMSELEIIKSTKLAEFNEDVVVEDKSLTNSLKADEKIKINEKEEIKHEENITENIDDELDDEKRQQMVIRIARKLSQRPKISPKNFDILSRSSFLMLNNYFEYLLADLLSYYYNKFQSSLNAKEFKVSLKELNEYETIQEITKHLIIKEVENIIVEKTFDQLLDHFEKSLNISLEQNIINWEKIVELRERRHLIVHNSSLVNKKYIARTGNPYKFNIGDVVHVDKEYFHNSYKYLRLAGNILLFNCWGNWDKENTNSAIYQMLINCFDSLNNKEYDVVLKICDYCEQITPKNAEQEDFIFRIKINQAIALKKLNNELGLKKVMDKIQVGTASPIFKIAFQILNDDHKDILENFRKAILLKELILDYYLEWPIFDFIRDNKDLNSKITKLFSK